MKTLIAFSLLVVVAYCDTYVAPDSSTIAQKNWTFIPPYPWSPTVRIDITYHSQNFQFVYCCQRYSIWGRRIDISPTSIVIHKPVEFRQKPRISLMWHMMPSNFNETRNYTLVMVDPDTPRAGARDFPRIHWIVANLNMKEHWKNDTLASYSGPHPPDQKPHHYVFLLYEQDNNGAVVNATAMNNTLPASRSLFNVQDFTRRFNLTLKGISWFQALNDEYVNYTKIMRNPASEPTYCAGKHQWSEHHGCVVYASGAYKMAVSLSLLMISFVALVKMPN